MKKIILILLILTLTACTKSITEKTPHEILLSIKDYNCKMQITYFSNKNSNEYTATQSYSTTGKYSMKFLDQTGLKIDFENSKLNISTNIEEASLNYENYNELNQNPLFLSYFINTYFNMEDSSTINTENNCIFLTLPSYNDYLYSAKLEFKNNSPYSLTYFDKNGKVIVNIIYNEFTYI